MESGNSNMGKQGGDEPGKAHELIENIKAPKLNQDIEKSTEPEAKSNPIKPEKRPREADHEQHLDKEKDKRPLKKRHLLSFGDQVGELEQALPIRHNLKAQTKSRKSSGQGDQDGASGLENRLREEYMVESERMKEEYFELEYSYWDTNNVVKKLRKKKKEKIIDLLDICRLELIEHFQCLVKSSPEDLLFVIKDFIVPHNMTIYEVEVLDIKDKTGEKVLNFHKVKLKKDHKEVEISVNLDGPARIVERSRYEKNKSIYPFVNWHTLHLGKPK